MRLQCIGRCRAAARVTSSWYLQRSLGQWDISHCPYPGTDAQTARTAGQEGCNKCQEVCGSRPHSMTDMDTNRCPACIHLAAQRHEPPMGAGTHLVHQANTSSTLPLLVSRHGGGLLCAISCSCQAAGSGKLGLSMAATYPGHPSWTLLAFPPVMRLHGWPGQAGRQYQLASFSCLRVVFLVFNEERSFSLGPNKHKPNSVVMQLPRVVDHIRLEGTIDTSGYFSTKDQKCKRGTTTLLSYRWLGNNIGIE